MLAFPALGGAAVDVVGATLEPALWWGLGLLPLAPRDAFRVDVVVAVTVVFDVVPVSEAIPIFPVGIVEGRG